jgi:hypothetical protein
MLHQIKYAKVKSGSFPILFFVHAKPPGRTELKIMIKQLCVFAPLREACIFFSFLIYSLLNLWGI